MTDWLDVSDITPRITYTASADQTEFVVPFVFFEDEDLAVYQNGTLLALAADYTVTGAEDEEGGTVTFLTGATLSDEIMIVRDVPIEQTTHIPPSGPFDIGALNLQISRLIAICQQLQHLVDRTIRLADNVSGELEIAEPVAGEFLKWNATEDGVESAAVVTSSDSYPIATQSEAEAGTLNTVLMTPLRVSQQIAATATQGACGGAITLTSGTAAPESDVTGTTAIYYTPSNHDFVEFFNGSSWAASQFTELTLNLDSDSGHTGYHQSGKNFYLGVFSDSGTIRFGSGVAWSSDTATGTGAGTSEVEIFEGRLVNKYDMVVRWGSSSGNTTTVTARQFTIVGGFRAVANGQTTDSLAKRMISNLQNPTIRPMRVMEATASWTYSASAYQQANASTANQLEWFHCVSGRSVSVHVAAVVKNSTAVVVNPSVAIGIDSTTLAVSGAQSDNIGVDTRLTGIKSIYRGFAGIGRHYAAWLEKGGTVDTQTWFSTGINSGIFGETLN